MTQLRQLKMAAKANALEVQRKNPLYYNGLSFEERLGLLMEQEQLSRDNTKLMRLRKEAGLRLRASPEELKYPAWRGIRPEQLTPLLQGHHLNYGQNLRITGATGCGKT